jgi:hypothetical protein
MTQPETARPAAKAAAKVQVRQAGDNAVINNRPSLVVAVQRNAADRHPPRPDPTNLSPPIGLPVRTFGVSIQTLKGLVNPLASKPLLPITQCEHRKGADTGIGLTVAGMQQTCGWNIPGNGALWVLQDIKILLC